jgi:hypothetical protein
MIHIADVQLARRQPRCGRLRVAAQTQVRIALDQELCVDAAMRVMADHAAFPQRRMLENKWTGLFAVARGAGLILPRHGQAAGWFQNVAAMRVMALGAVHFLLHHRMMLWQPELGLYLAVAFVTGSGASAGVDNEPPPTTARAHVEAPRPVA